MQVFLKKHVLLLNTVHFTSVPKLYFRIKQPSNLWEAPLSGPSGYWLLMNTEASASSSLKRNLIKSRDSNRDPICGSLWGWFVDRLNYNVIVTPHQNSCPEFEQWLKTSELAYNCWDHFQQLTQSTELPFSVNPSYCSLLAVAEGVCKGTGTCQSRTGRQRAGTSLFWNNPDVTFAERRMKRSRLKTSFHFLLSSWSH